MCCGESTAGQAACTVVPITRGLKLAAKVRRNKPVCQGFTFATTRLQQQPIVWLRHIRMHLSPALAALAICLLATVGCQEGHVNVASFKKQMEARKVYRLTEVEVMAGAEQVGRGAVAKLDSAQQAASAATPCTTALAPVLKALAEQEITATRLIFSNWHPVPDQPKVNQVLDALAYTHAAGQPIPDNLQKDGKGGFHFVQALTVPSAQCQACHKGWAQGQTVGVFNLRFGSRPAVKVASKGKKGM